MALSLMQRSVQIALLVDRVGVGEEQPAASGAASCRPEGVVLARPARLELPCLDDGDAGKGAGDLRSPVGGVIVDENQLPVAAQLEEFFGLADK